MKVALVHEHLAQDGGAESVLRSFQDTYPSAPTYTIVYDPRHAHNSFADKDIRTSFIQRLPGGVRHYKWYLPLMPTAVERFDLSQFDVVLSSVSAFAKGVITRPDSVHICYCHSPTRYLWTDTHDYIEALPYPRILKRYIERHLTSLRMWDRLAADRPDFYIANSQAVRQRIQKYYRRESAVVHPPVATEQFSIAGKTEKYFLAGGRLVAYKRFDLPVMAANRLGVPLMVFGDGPEMKRLRSLAKKNVTFLGRVSDAERAELYRKAVAFINPQEEDFGITVVEAMASGRPVIAYRRGGACETVREGESGVFFDDQEWESLADAMIRLKPENFSPTAIRTWSERFSTQQFKKKIQEFVESHIPVKGQGVSS